MKNILFAVFLLGALAACTPTQPTMTDAQSTATSVAWTQVKLTLETISTDTPTDTPTVILIEFTPSPLPTQPPIPFITPDPIQVERWQEYQIELARAILYGYDPASLSSALCEWDILGQSGQEVYVWADCSIPDWGNDNRPATIHLKPDGSIQTIEVLWRGSDWTSNIQRMFPTEVQEKFYLYTGDSLFFGRRKEFTDHYIYRLSHPEEPPLIVLSAIPIATPTP